MFYVIFYIIHYIYCIRTENFNIAMIKIIIVEHTAI